jgi:outer membrane protein OmpA-like peptidoglycan-associated protein
MLLDCSVDMAFSGDSGISDESPKQLESLESKKLSEQSGGLDRDVEKLALIVSEFASVKSEIVDYYQRHGRLPRAADMRQPLTPSGDIRLLENGIVEAIVDRSAEVVMYWRPVSKSSWAGLNWECTSPRIMNFDRLLPNCSLDPTYDKDAPVILDTRVSEYLTFAFGHDDTKWLTDDSERRLQRLTQKLVTAQEGEIFEIHLSGYTDPIGGIDSNVKLAEARAISVRDALVASGVNRSLISIRGVGVDPKPKHDCPESLARSARIQCSTESRRVDIVAILRKQL